MKEQKIQQLINRYMEGLTSPDEERQLAEWFSTHEVPEEWAAYKEMFAWLDDGMPATPGILDKEEADEKTDAKATPEPMSKAESKKIEEQSLSDFKSIRRKRYLIGWISAAAAVALLIVLFTGRQSADTSAVDRQEVATTSVPETQQSPADNRTSVGRDASIADTTAQSRSQTERADSLDNKLKRSARRKKPMNRYRRFRRSLVRPETYVAQAEMDSLSHQATMDVNNELMKQQIYAYLLEQQVDSIERYQQMCLDADLYREERSEEEDITY
ncbi:MAG: hypothetical protein ACOYJF_03735 [Prevotella sp.]|jgi:hypothetical protein